MTFSIHIDDELGRELARLALELGQSRNSLIAASVRQFLERERMKEWSPEVLEMLTHPMECDLPPFESYRAELKAPRMADV